MAIFTVVLSHLQETNLIILVALKTDRDDGAVKYHSQKARWVIEWSTVSTKRESATSPTPPLTCIYVCDELLLMTDYVHLFVWLGVNFTVHNQSDFS